MNAWWRASVALARRDLLTAWRARSEVGQPVLFFVIVASLFPLALGPDPRTLAALAPGILWVATLLASLLSLEAMYRSDFDDGSLEQLILSPHPLALLAAVKALAHWVATGLPLVLAAPVVALAFGMQGEATWVMLASLALGTPALSLLGAVGVALTVGLARGGLLIALVLLPLYIPVLIFAAGAVSAAVDGLPAGPALYMLGALLVLALSACPFATAAALRVRAEG